MSFFSSEWAHYHNQTSVTDHNNNVLSTNKPSLMSHINDVRPTKMRKSRVSKRSPVTVLNADVSNFRALVQQLTGRPSAPTRLRAQGGPFNINFRQFKESNTVDSGHHSAPKMLPFMYSKYHHQQQQQWHYFPQQVTMEHEQNLMPSSSGQSKGSIAVAEFCDNNSRTNNSNNYWDEYDDLDVEECLEELAWVGVATTNVDEKYEHS